MSAARFLLQYVVIPCLCLSVSLIWGAIFALWPPHFCDRSKKNCWFFSLFSFCLLIGWGLGGWFPRLLHAALGTGSPVARSKIPNDGWYLPCCHVAKWVLWCFRRQRVYVSLCSKRILFCSFLTCHLTEGIWAPHTFCFEVTALGTFFLCYLHPCSV